MTRHSTGVPSGQERGGPGWSALRVCRAAMWLFAAAFTVFWPLYAVYVLLTPVSSGDVAGMGWKVLVGVMTFAYWVVVRLRFYTRREAPPRRVILEHYHHRRWF